LEIKRDTPRLKGGIGLVVFKERAKNAKEDPGGIGQSRNKKGQVKKGDVFVSHKKKKLAQTKGERKPGGQWGTAERLCKRRLFQGINNRESSNVRLVGGEMLHERREIKRGNIESQKGHKALS